MSSAGLGLHVQALHRGIFNGAPCFYGCLTEQANVEIEWREVQGTSVIVGENNNDKWKKLGLRLDVLLMLYFRSMGKIHRCFTELSFNIYPNF